MRGGIEADRLVPVEPADGSRGVPHLGRIHQQDEIRGKAAEGAGAVLRRVGAFEHQEGNRNGPGSLRPGPLAFRKAPRDEDPGGVVAVEFLPHPDHRYATRPGLPGMPCHSGALVAAGSALGLPYVARMCATSASLP